MMEQSAVVQRALNALRAVCIAGPEQGRIDCLEQVTYHPPEAYKQEDWFVNGKLETVFPHCPRCASYALYRKDNMGAYECLTCGLTKIGECTARRVQ